MDLATKSCMLADAGYNRMNHVCHDKEMVDDELNGKRWVKAPDFSRSRRVDFMTLKICLGVQLED